MADEGLQGVLNDLCQQAEGSLIISDNAAFNPDNTPLPAAPLTPSEEYDMQSSSGESAGADKDGNESPMKDTYASHASQRRSPQRLFSSKLIDSEFFAADSSSGDCGPVQSPSGVIDLVSPSGGNIDDAIAEAMQSSIIYPSPGLSQDSYFSQPGKALSLQVHDPQADVVASAHDGAAHPSTSDSLESNDSFKTAASKITPQTTNSSTCSYETSLSHQLLVTQSDSSVDYVHIGIEKFEVVRTATGGLRCLWRRLLKGDAWQQDIDPELLRLVKIHSQDAGKEDSGLLASQWPQDFPVPMEIVRQNTVDPQLLRFAELRSHPLVAEDPTVRMFLKVLPKFKPTPVRVNPSPDFKYRSMQREIIDHNGKPSETKIFVVSQTRDDIGCCLMVDDAPFCSFYYIPYMDTVIFWNQSDGAVVLDYFDDGSLAVQILKAGRKTRAKTGSWTVSVDNNSIITFHVLPRGKYWETIQGVSATALKSDTRPTTDLLAWMNHPLLGTFVGTTIRITDEEKHSYTLTRTKNIAETRVSSRPRDPPVADLHAAQHWMNEVQAHNSMPAHDNMVKLHGYDARFLCSWQEYIEAPSLDKIRDLNSFYTGPRHDALKIIHDIASALSAMHNGKGTRAGQEYLHMDVKPGNIVYHPQKGAVLIDFGIARNASLPPCLVSGSSHYTAPEFLHENAIRGPLADVWALGVTGLYLTRHIPIPERKSNPTWLISNIHRAKNGLTRLETMEECSRWIEYIIDIRVRLDSSDPVEVLLCDMLEPNVLKRLDAESVVQCAKGIFERMEKNDAFENMLVEESEEEKDAEEATDRRSPTVEEDWLKRDPSEGSDGSNFSQTLVNSNEDEGSWVAEAEPDNANPHLRPTFSNDNASPSGFFT
ncbi:hypothetical protein S40293_07160 [Stachybotrys chartarum IBT 40293]|nr:hypothetical protein S40293_07160 [Stachybotrys chartarum IBT 40293]